MFLLFTEHLLRARDHAKWLMCISHLILPQGGQYPYPHFKDEKTKVQKVLDLAPI